MPGGVGRGHDRENNWRGGVPTPATEGGVATPLRSSGFSDGASIGSVGATVDVGGHPAGAWRGGGWLVLIVGTGVMLVLEGLQTSGDRGAFGNGR
jgi:hypothetical protein